MKGTIVDGVVNNPNPTGCNVIETISVLKFPQVQGSLQLARKVELDQVAYKNFDHLLVLTICIHHLSHPLSLCGITYQIVLKLLLSLYLRLTYHISKHCYLCSLCPFST